MPGIRGEWQKTRRTPRCSGVGHSVQYVCVGGQGRVMHWKSYEMVLWFAGLSF
jgi:hypothetical protein